MYALKIEDVKSRAKVRNYSGLFSMGALAVALSACGSEFKLKEEGGVVINDKGALVLTFDADVKEVDGTKVKLNGVALTAKDVEKNGKSATIKLATESNNHQLIIEAGGIKGDGDNEYTATTAVTVDNKAPSAEGATVAGNVVTVTFDEAISSAVASKFTISGTAATGTAVVSGNTVKVTFADAPSGTVTIEAGAVTDDPANKLNQVGNENVAETKDIDGSSGGGDTTPPKLESLEVDKADKTFTVRFDEDIQGISGADLKTKVKIGGALTIDGATDTDKIASAVVSGKTLVITLATAETVADGNYTVEILTGAVEDTAGNDFDGGTTTEATAASLDDGLVGVGGLSSDSDYGF